MEYGRASLLKNLMPLPQYRTNTLIYLIRTYLSTLSGSLTHLSVVHLDEDEPRIDINVESHNLFIANLESCPVKCDSGRAQRYTTDKAGVTA